MKKYFTIALIALTFAASASNADSLSTDSTKKFRPFHELTLSSRGLWRGIDFGNGSPSAFGMFGVSNEHFEFGMFGTTPLSGTNVGYGNTFNVYATARVNGLSFTLDDYYFNGDVTNVETEYFDWEKSHFLEGRLRYDIEDRFYVSGAYSLYTGNLYAVKDSIDNTKAAYFEMGYTFCKFTFAMGGITGPSALNFHDKEGITNVSLKYKSKLEKLKGTPIEIGLCYNPNFRNVSPAGLPRVGYGRSAFNFVISITLK